MQIELSRREIQTIINSLEELKRKLQISTVRYHKCEKYEEAQKCMDKLSTVANVLAKINKYKEL